MKAIWNITDQKCISILFYLYNFTNFITQIFFFTIIDVINYDFNNVIYTNFIIMNNNVSSK